MTKEIMNTTVPTVNKSRPGRKKVYERIRETEIPENVISHFAKEEYELRWVRWLVNGVEDYKNLSHREKEGYEFVTADELPKSYLSSIKVTDSINRPGLVTYGDLCLMKVDKDLRKSRQKYFDGEADSQIDSVNIHVLEKKGFINQGTKTKVSLKEPSFQGD